MFESRIGHASKNLTRSSPPQPDGGEDLFCHVSAIMDGNALREGDTVQFVQVWCGVRTHALSWPNGQGVALLRRRLRVRVPPGAPSTFCFRGLMDKASPS